MASIKGLTAFLRDVKSLKDEELSNCYLVVDTLSFCHHVSESYTIQSQYHGSLLYLASKLEEYLTAFKQCSIKPLFVIRGNGIPSKTTRRSKNWNKRLEELMKIKKDAKNEVDADEVHCDILFEGIQNILTDLLERHNIPSFNCAMEVGISAVVSLAAYLDCPILCSNSQHYFAHHSFKLGHKFRFILMSDLKPKPQKSPRGLAISCTSFCPSDSFMKSIKSDKLPILAILLSSDPEKNKEIPNEIRRDMEISSKPMARGAASRGGRGGRPAPQRPLKPMTAKMRACIKYIEKFPDSKTLVSQLVICQKEESRKDFVIWAHHILMELFPPTYEYGKELAALFKVETPFPSGYFSRSDTFTSGVIDGSSTFRDEMLKILEGKRVYPKNCDLIAFPLRDHLKSLRFNEKRMASALYLEEGRHLSIRLEDYGSLPSVNRVATPLRQLLNGILLNLDMDNLNLLRGYDESSKTVTEYINEFGKEIKGQLKLKPFALTSKSTLSSLLSEIEDFDFQSSKLTDANPPWISSVALIAAYWFKHTGIKDSIDKQFIKSAFIIIAIFNGFFTQGCEKMKLDNDETFHSKLLGLFDDYASQLKKGSHAKTLNLTIVHGLTELFYVESYLSILNDILPEKNNHIKFLSPWELFPHGRLFHWIATHRNMKTNHIKNLCMFVDNQETAGLITKLTFATMKLCDDLAAKPLISTVDRYL